MFITKNNQSIFHFNFCELISRNITAIRHIFGKWYAVLLYFRRVQDKHGENVCAPHAKHPKMHCTCMENKKCLHSQRELFYLIGPTCVIYFFLSFFSLLLLLITFRRVFSVQNILSIKLGPRANFSLACRAQKVFLNFLFGIGGP